MHANHTPGPWYTMGAGVYTGSAQNDTIAHIATAHFYGVPGDPMANARLIAAAPELLAALQDLTVRYERLLMDTRSTKRAEKEMAELLPRYTEQARAAIARATGVDHA